MQVVIFKINDEQFAVETSKVQGINDMMEITLVPKAPQYIMGLINLRGNIISLVDINLMLETKGNKQSLNKIIILNLDEESIGIAVSEVNEVLDIDESIVEKSEDNMKNSYINGVINLQERIVTLIDVEKLMLN
jgi:purine-binding chemotaxis protein CheW